MQVSVSRFQARRKPTVPGVISSALQARHCDPLEPRLFLHGAAGFDAVVSSAAGHQPHFDEIVNIRRMRRLAMGTAVSDVASASLAGAYALSGIPALNSNPNARAQLYLDFDGDSASNWGSYNVPETPAYDVDGDATTFSDVELAAIRQIWARVAEKYSPFNINVTTVNPGTLADKVAMRVVIGGGGAWSGGTYGGVSYVGSFYNSSPNTAYVFENNLGNGNAKYTAEAVAHEAGHGFGLQHQSKYDSSGTKLEEYSTGANGLAPVMGNSYYASRGLWWYGTSASASTMQDDLAILAGTSNGFGYRADDYGNSIGTASSLLVSGAVVSGSGLIEKSTDRDYFSFTTDAGTISLAGRVVADGPMLDLKLELWTAGGTLVASADTGSLGEMLTATVAGGSYRLVVASHGNYGDVGQYTISGTIIPPMEYISAPSSLTAMVVSAWQVDLAWADQSNNESGFSIQRSEDGGATWNDLGTAAANVTVFTDATVLPGISYAYRVLAYGSGSQSDYSNTLAVTTVPSTPTGLTAIASSGTQISVAWNDVEGETGYRIERSLDGVSGWAQVGMTAADVTRFENTGLSAGTTYCYRVVATGLGGDAVPSAVASTTTPVLTVPTAPTNVSATLSGKNKVLIRWTDTSSNETGFKVQRSLDGVTWSLVATLAANTTSYTDASIKRGTTYRYRVCAYNLAGNSSFTMAGAAFGEAVPPWCAKAIGKSRFSVNPIPRAAEVLLALPGNLLA